MVAVPPRSRNGLVVALVIALIAGLPLAVWLDLRDISEATLRRQASDLNTVITGIRGFYGSDVVGRVLAAPGGHTIVTHDYDAVPGAIPIPATFSLELGRVISAGQANILYRFVSDYPFKNRAPHQLDAFERDALTTLRRQPDQQLTRVSWNGATDRVRLIAPIIMQPACVACHNVHPLSPKHDWKVGDVRGIQELDINGRIAANIWSFRYLLAYLVLAAAAGLGFILLQRRQTATIEATANFLSIVSTKLSRYLSPQIYDSIFSGRSDVTIHTERKKLTIFFSDIKDFTSTTESLQPEELTALLNEYFSEMSHIALAHGGTVDKFIGDAMLVFFGDPETKGVTEDAAAAVRMAIAMQRRMAELSVAWRRRGVERPFRVRMGINTGYCNVGNFGSADRMDYTIIGAEANLSSRLESMADPGSIVLSYETYALVRDFVAARPLAPIAYKGIARPVVPYVVEGVIDDGGQVSGVFSEHAPGLDLYLDVDAVDAAGAETARRILRDALAALERRP